MIAKSRKFVLLGVVYPACKVVRFPGFGFFSLRSGFGL